MHSLVVMMILEFQMKIIEGKSDCSCRFRANVED
jgi:hypothetical protein